jgi:hypothetical protein
MRSPRAFRHQVVDRLADQLVWCVAEQVLDLAVGVGDDAPAIADQFGIRTGVEDRLQADFEGPLTIPGTPQYQPDGQGRQREQGGDKDQLFGFLAPLGKIIVGGQADDDVGGISGHASIGNDAVDAVESGGRPVGTVVGVAAQIFLKRRRYRATADAAVGARWRRIARHERQIEVAQADGALGAQMQILEHALEAVERYARIDDAAEGAVRLVDASGDDHQGLMA